MILSNKLHKFLKLVEIPLDEVQLFCLSSILTELNPVSILLGDKYIFIPLEINLLIPSLHLSYIVPGTT